MRTRPILLSSPLHATVGGVGEQAGGRGGGGGGVDGVLEIGVHAALELVYLLRCRGVSLQSERPDARHGAAELRGQCS